MGDRRRRNASRFFKDKGHKISIKDPTYLKYIFQLLCCEETIKVKLPPVRVILDETEGKRGVMSLTVSGLIGLSKHSLRKESKIY